MKYSGSNEEYKMLYTRLLRFHKASGLVHAGGSISILPVVYVLFSGVFDVKHDILIFSKGHTASALFCVLALRGFISESELENCGRDGVRLGVHHPKKLVNFSPFGTGSLGHGASLAAGIALGKKLMHKPGRVFCICGDGEFQEGSCWEAIIFSSRHKLNNLKIIIDCNNWQGFDSVKHTAGYTSEGLADRLSAFNLNIALCDVHDFEAINSDLEAFHEQKTSVLLVNSIKGEGMGIYEDTLASHYVKINDEIYNSSVKSLVMKAGAVK